MTATDASETLPEPELQGLRVPIALRDDVAQILDLTDGFCLEHLDVEYAQLCRRLVAALSRKRPSPLARGDLRIWAAGAIYAVGSTNFLFDRAEQPHLTADDLAVLTGVAKSTMANKAGAIRRALGIAAYDPQWCRRTLVERHPYAWLVEVDGVVVDARCLPPSLLEAAQRRGLVPIL